MITRLMEVKYMEQYTYDDIRAMSKVSIMAARHR